MDDFSVSTLHESRNEWASRLLTILTPLIIDGYKCILEEAIKLCKENDEMDKYLMTFQNFITRIPKWNPTIIETERKRICDKSGCSYLEELVTCVHIIQLKVLTAMRVGQKQKKIDINIPKLDDFIHKVYINVARKVYKNVYLFEINIPPLQIQKNNRELEIIIQECILNTLRESIPIESILKAYMDETTEEDIIEEVKEQYFDTHIDSSQVNSSNNLNGNALNSNIVVDNNSNGSNSNSSSNNLNNVNDNVILSGGNIVQSQMSQGNINDSYGNYGNVEKINITNQNTELNDLDIHVLDEPEVKLLPDLLIDDIEILN